MLPKIAPVLGTIQRDVLDPDEIEAIRNTSMHLEDEPQDASKKLGGAKPGTVTFSEGENIVVDPGSLRPSMQLPPEPQLQGGRPARPEELHFAEDEDPAITADVAEIQIEDPAAFIALEVGRLGDGIRSYWDNYNWD